MDGGRDTQVAHIVHSRPAVRRAQRRRGPPRKGAGARARDGITAPRIRARASTSPGGATRAWGRAASLTSPSNRTRELVQQRLSVRPSVRLFIPACKLFVRMEGGAGSDGRRRRGGGGPTTWKLPPAARPDTHSPLA